MLLVNNSTPGFYNQSLGDLHFGSSNLSNQSYFFGPNASTGDPRTVFKFPPDLTTVPPLANWLTSPSAAITNGIWGKTKRAIPTTWAANTETAILYEVDGGRFGVSNLVGDFGVDNGIFVWVNGQYRFGATAPGAAKANEYPNVVLGNLNPGQNWVQVLRSDHGGATGSFISVVGDYNSKPVPEPDFTALLFFAIAALGLFVCYLRKDPV